MRVIRKSKFANRRFPDLQTFRLSDPQTLRLSDLQT
jgi:hypothetical protein